MDSEERYEEMKAMIKEEISNLLIHQEANDIMAVKEVKAEEQRLNPALRVMKRDEELTSMHQAAAEVAVSRMRKFIYLKRKHKGLSSGHLLYKREPLG